MRTCVHEGVDARAEIDELRRRLAAAEAALRDRTAVEAALGDAEERRRKILDSIDEGFCIIEVIGGEQGEPVDYRFLQTNAAFERQTGLADAVGQRMRAMEPDHEEHWFERYSRIARTQTPERFEDRADALGRWYDVYAFPIDDPRLRRVGILFRDVIERKRHEQELARSNHLLRTTFDSSREIIQLFKAVRDGRNAIVDFEWLLTNKQWNDRWGSNVGKRLLAENPAVVESGVWDKFLQVMETGAPITHEHYYKHEQFDGWFLQTIAKADDGILLSTLDITESKQAELALRESEARYRSLFETMGQGYCDVELVRDSEGRAGDQLYFELNPALERLFGIDAASARGRKASEVFGDVVPARTETYDQVVKRGAPARIEQEVGERWFEVFAYPRGGDRLVALYEEVTERKRVEQRLRESEARFRQFAEASSDVLWIRDAMTLAATYVSAAAASVYGAPPERLIGDRAFWDSLVVPDDRAAMAAQLEDGAKGEASVAEFRVLRPSDGVFRWIRRTAFPLLGPQGEVQAVAGISSVVTETRLLSDHQGVLLAELQHRVRNIMAVIRSIAARTAERAEGVAQYAELLAGRLLALARVQALLTRGANVHVDVGDIVRDEVRAQAQHEGQYDLIGPKAALSPKAAEVLTLAVHELVTNALKYGALSVPHGKVTVRWAVAAKGGVPWLVLDWTEEGAPERPAPNVEAARRGFGSELIEGRIPYELNGEGRMTIEAGGASCHLEFPLQQGASVLETGAPRRATVFGGSLDMAGEADLGGRSVLVVEDEYYLASDLARALRRAGAKVLGPCSTEAEARAKLQEEVPDAVVLDINLGQGAMFDLAEALNDLNLPFVFVTGYDQSVIPQAFGDVERLEKPVQLGRMVDAVSKLMRPAGPGGSQV